MDEKIDLDQVKSNEICIMKLEILLIGALNVNFQEIPKQNILLIMFRANKPLQKKLNTPENIMLVLGKRKARFILISLYFQYGIHIVYVFIDKAIKFGTVMPKVMALGITVPNELHFNFLNIRILIISTISTKISNNVAG
ncbi:27802_t:CDS:1, partial [Gigaspora margarita]